MSYSTREYIADCEENVKRVRLIAKHYPNAHQERRGSERVWCDDGALANATHFQVEVREQNGEQRAVLCPYHLLTEGEVSAVVFAAGWEGYCEGWDLLRRAKARPEIHAAIMALLKEATR